MSKNTEKSIVDEARGTFDLVARLQGVDMPSGKTTVFTDRKLGIELRHVREEQVATYRAQRDAIVNEETGEVIADAVPLDQEKVEALEQREKEILEELESTAITFEYLAIHEGTAKAIEARSVAKYKKDGQIQVEDMKYAKDFLYSLYLSKAIVKYLDHQSGAVNYGLDEAVAVALPDLLPPDQWKKLVSDFDDVQAKSTINHSITESPDF